MTLLVQVLLDALQDRDPEVVQRVRARRAGEAALAFRSSQRTALANWMTWLDIFS